MEAVSFSAASDCGRPVVTAFSSEHSSGWFAHAPNTDPLVPSPFRLRSVGPHPCCVRRRRCPSRRDDGGRFDPNPADEPLLTGYVRVSTDQQAEHGPAARRSRASTTVALVGLALGADGSRRAYAASSVVRLPSAGARRSRLAPRRWPTRTGWRWFRRHDRLGVLQVQCCSATGNSGSDSQPTTWREAGAVADDVEAQDQDHASTGWMLGSDLRGHVGLVDVPTTVPSAATLRVLTHRRSTGSIVGRARSSSALLAGAGISAAMSPIRSVSSTGRSGCRRASASRTRRSGRTSTTLGPVAFGDVTEGVDQLRFCSEMVTRRVSSRAAGLRHTLRPGPVARLGGRRRRGHPRATRRPVARPQAPLVPLGSGPRRSWGGEWWRSWWRRRWPWPGPEGRRGRR